MTIEEFDNVKWKKGMWVKLHSTNEYQEVASIDFEECLIGYIQGRQLVWKRCENVTLKQE